LLFSFLLPTLASSDAHLPTMAITGSFICLYNGYAVHLRRAALFLRQQKL
jgi:hypothetical protein